MFDNYYEVIDEDRFKRDIRKYMGDYKIYIIKPRKPSMEEYAFAIEADMKNQYGVDIHNSVSYVDYWDQKRNPHLPDEDTVILYDPMCAVEEIGYLKDKLSKIGDLADGY